MNILALETSTDACSVALLRSDGEIYGYFDLAPRQHTRLLPRMLGQVLADAALTQADLNCVAYANGPGAFTGVRIAAATAQGIAIALDIPMVAVSTLAVMAQQVFVETDAQRAQVALDARMNEAYCAVYRRDQQTGLALLETEEQLMGIDQLQALPDVVNAGSGFTALIARQGPISGVTLIETLFPNATALVTLAQQKVQQQHEISADQVEINYLRNRVAEKSKSLNA